MGNHTFSRLVALVFLALAASAWTARGAAVLDAGAYGVAVEESGHASAVAALGDSGFTDAYPMLWSNKTKGLSPLAMPHAKVTREEVTDPLGKGFRLVLEDAGCTWQITAYSGLPFLTARVIHENTGSETERVTMLVPWASEKACTLGAQTNRSAILDNGTLFDPKARLRKSESKDIASLWNLAAHNPATGHSLIAGFLTNARAYAQVHVTRGTDLDADSFDLFRAECRYDAPVELAPGERLASELFYIAIAEASPFVGLERFAASVAAFNGLQPTRHALPHGWDSWVSHYHKDISEQEMLAELALADKHLKRYGWTHFSLDDGWQRGAGDWEADPERFPSGMKAFADAIHARGMTAGLWTEPFTVDIETPLAQEHPEWLAKPGFMGKSLLGDDERILDITAPGAYEHLRDVYSKIIGTWGYDALVETDFVYHLLAAGSYSDPAVTHAEALCRGMQAIRDGAGKDAFIMGVAPFAITGYTADGMRAGVDCGPIWRNTADHWCWGCVDTLTNVARRYYFSPHVFALDQDCAFFGHEATRKRWKVDGMPMLTRAQQVAWMTGAALTGGAVKIGDAYTQLTPEEFDVLRRLLPVMPRPARPIDLFEREEAQVWVLPIDSAIGQWHIAAVFNWNETEEEVVSLSFSKMGLETGIDYAVFDFWPGAYCGLAKDKIELAVPPGSVRLLSLRPYEKRPMFLATDSHFSQGATDFEHLAWNTETRTLSGRFRGIEDTGYVLSILVPEGYEEKEAFVSVGDARVVPAEDMARLEFHCAAAGPVDWRMQF